MSAKDRPRKKQGATAPQEERNARIARQYRLGSSYAAIARQEGISPTRVRIIVMEDQKRKGAR